MTLPKYLIFLFSVCFAIALPQSLRAAQAPAAFYKFDDGLPPGTAVYGSAMVNTNSGILELNPNSGSQQSAFLSADLAPGRVARGFLATFRARMIPGTPVPGDGFSFNWAHDLPNGPYATGEEGTGGGLTVVFDTFENGPGEAPAIEVKWNGNVVAHYDCPLGFLVTGNFVDVRIQLHSDGLLDLSYNSQDVYSRLPIPGYTPLMNTRFGFGSRTGAAWETHDIDELALELALDPTNGIPTITTISNRPPNTVLIAGNAAPAGNTLIETSTNLIDWIRRAKLAVTSNGRWQFTEAPALPYRFHRLSSFPQMPANLVNWWRADGDYADIFNANHGSSTNLGFALGQRGKGFNFDVTNQVMVISTFALPVPWTTAFWVKRHDAVGRSAALLTDTASGLKLEQINTARLVGFTAFGAADYSFNYSVPTNVWTHLAYVAAPNGTTLYVNGIAVATNPTTIPLPRALLGARPNGAEQLHGVVDEVVTFTRALPPNEIQQVINATRGP